MLGVRVRRAKLLTVFSELQNNALGKLWKLTGPDTFQYSRSDLVRPLGLPLGSVNRLFTKCLKLGLMTTTFPGERLHETMDGALPSVRLLTFVYDRPYVGLLSETLAAIEAAGRILKKGGSRSLAFEKAVARFGEASRKELEASLQKSLREITSPVRVIAISTNSPTHDKLHPYQCQNPAPRLVHIVNKVRKITTKPNVSVIMEKSPSVGSSTPVATQSVTELRSGQLLISNYTNSKLELAWIDEISEKLEDAASLRSQHEAAPHLPVQPTSVELRIDCESVSTSSGTKPPLDLDTDGREPPSFLDSFKSNADGTITLGGCRKVISTELLKFLPAYPSGKDWPQLEVAPPPQFDEIGSTSLVDVHLCEVAYRAAWFHLTGATLSSHWQPLKATTKSGRKNPTLTKISRCVDQLKTARILRPHLWAIFRIRQMYYQTGGVPSPRCTKAARNFTSAFSRAKLDSSTSIEIFWRENMHNYSCAGAEPTRAQLQAISQWNRLQEAALSAPNLTEAKLLGLVSTHYADRGIDNLKAAAQVEAANFTKAVVERINQGYWVWL